MLNACTIIACNYLPFASVLADSFLAHHPGATFTTLLVDDEARRVSTNDRVRFVRLGDLGLDEQEIRRLAAIYDVTELATAVKPLLLARLLDELGGELMYLDPDIRVYDTLVAVGDLARTFGIVLTPHTMRPFPDDDRRVDALFVLAAGVYNLGFIGVNAKARPFLDWWWHITRRHALADVARNMFTDQRWIDFVPSFYDHAILKDPGFNVAYWNLHGRDLAGDGQAFTVDGVPLRFFHFSGFNPTKPWLLSKYQDDRPRILLSERPALSRLCADYARAVKQAAADGGASGSYVWGKTASGVTLTTRMRRLYRDALLRSEKGCTTEPPNPFETARPDAFVSWLNEPVAPGSRLSRYLASIRADRIDLQIQFPDLTGADADRYLNWLWRDSDIRETIPAELLPVEPAENALPAAVSESRALQSGGVSIAGYFRAELGIGEAARALVTAIDAASIPHSTITYDATLNRQRHPFEDRQREIQYDVTVLCVNADSTLQFVRAAGPHFLEGRYTVGFWFWELSHFPDSMHAAFGAVDEVWAASDFVADAIRRAGNRPVFTMPLPVRTPQPIASATRTDVGLPEAFTFLFMFDFLSVVERKNPLGLIRAFKAAFRPGEGPVLVIKSINGHLRIDECERVRLAAGDRADIRIIDGYVTSEERDSILALCDCYVSLHRSEGLGLTMAEAMALGKPVIGTNYSGNLQFMTSDNSYLVDFRPGSVPAGCDPYPEGAVWADPDESHASRLMRLVYEQPEAAAAMGARARADIANKHGVESSARALGVRLQQIREQRKNGVAMRSQSSPQPVTPGASSDPDNAAAASLEALLPQLEQLTEPQVAATGPLASLRIAAQRMLYRVLRPYAFQQQLLHRQMIEGLRQATVALRRERQVRESLEKRVRVLTRELSATRREVHSLDSHRRSDNATLPTDTRAREDSALSRETQ